MVYLPPPPPRPPRDIVEITRLIEKYEPNFRRWCDSPERGGCACMGCVRWPAYDTLPYRGDPEGKPFPNPDDQLTREEVAIYRASPHAKVGERRSPTDP